MDLTTVYCNLDDFYCNFSFEPPHDLLLGPRRVRQRSTSLSPSELMTILVMFHQSRGYRNFKGYYTEQVLGRWHREFPEAPSYTRVVQLLPQVLWPLAHYLGSRRGEVTGISFVDSTPLKVCRNARIHSHKVFGGLAQRGKTSTGWFFGFKLHLIINDRSDLLGVRLTPGNVDDRLTVPELANGLFGKLFGDRGYISQALRNTLQQQGVELITKLRKNIKPKLLSLMDKILLRKRALIETVNDQLKNVCQIEHSRHRSPINAFVHLIAGLVAYTWQEKRPALSWTREEQEILNAHKQLVCA
ncbi:MAG: IS982 family transposase [SAR324 cluster bacterium]|nr:IS982 family transposase [SAR324 cluster bacterium]